MIKETMTIELSLAGLQSTDEAAMRKNIGDTLRKLALEIEAGASFTHTVRHPETGRACGTASVKIEGDSLKDYIKLIQGDRS